MSTLLISLAFVVLLVAHILAVRNQFRLRGIVADRDRDLRDANVRGSMRESTFNNLREVNRRLDEKLAKSVADHTLTLNRNLELTRQLSEEELNHTGSLDRILELARQLTDATVASKMANQTIENLQFSNAAAIQDYNRNYDALVETLNDERRLSREQANEQNRVIREKCERIQELEARLKEAEDCINASPPRLKGVRYGTGVRHLGGSPVQTPMDLQRVADGIGSSSSSPLNQVEISSSSLPPEEVDKLREAIKNANFQIRSDFHVPPNHTLGSWGNYPLPNPPMKQHGIVHESEFPYSPSPQPQKENETNEPIEPSRDFPGAESIAGEDRENPGQ